MVPPAPEALPEGRLFAGRWNVVRCLRAGGMGAVYEVVHRETQARSALKVLLPELVGSGEMRARFRQEAMVTATIESDHIVKVFDGGTDAETGAPFLVMELLRGEDLAARVARGPLPAEEVVLLLGQAALALERTHAAGVVHRDLKPANLFVTTRDDGSLCLKVLDFGISKVVASASQAETTRAVGTPLYMAPEQVKGDGAIAAPADLYALGQIAYTLLAGTPYWAAEQGESKNVYPVLLAVAAGLKEPASVRAARVGATLPAAFDAWFAQATAIAPEARFSGARAMIDELARVLGVAAPQARASADPPRPSAGPMAAAQPTYAGIASDTLPQARRSRVLVVASGVVAAAALAAIAWSVRGGARDASPAAATASTVATAGASAASVAVEPPPSAAPSAAAPPVPAPTQSSAPSASTSARPVTVPSPKPRPTISAKPEPALPASAPPSDPSDVYRKGKKP